MKRSLTLLAALFLAGGLLVGGCDDDGSDTIITTLVSSNFPGSPIASHNEAPDGRAFTHADRTTQDVDITVYWHKQANQAILLWEDSFADFWASYFDGSSFTPPVEIQGDNMADGSVEGFKVLWLNTSGHADSNARARNGDAIILFRSGDAQPGNAVDEDGNVRLYASYFDRSRVGQAASGTIMNGFETLATTVDFDNQVDGLGPGPGDDPDVTDFGFVSDSLECTHLFTSATNSVDSGDPTDAVFFVWEKNQSEGTTGRDDRFQFVEFDLTQSGNAMPTQGSATANTLSGGEALTAGEDVDPDNEGFVVHDTQAAWRHEVEDPSGGIDQFVTASLFSAGSTPSAVNLGSSAVDTTATTDDVQLPSPANVYGPDHGLPAYFYVFSESGFSDGADGSRAPDEDLMVAQIDEGATSRQLEEIDNFDSTTNTIDNVDDDGGTDGGDRSGTEAPVAGFETRINRTAEYITVGFLQNNTDATDFDDGDPTVGDARRNELFYAQVVQTRQGNAVRALSDSILGSPLQSPSLVADGGAGGTGSGQADVHAPGFQTELAQGQATSQSNAPCHCCCAFQTDRFRMNWTYEQLEDQSGGSIDEERLLVNGLTVTLGSDATTAPGASLASGSEVVVDDVDTDTGYAGGGDHQGQFDPIAVDNGDAGEVNVYFRQQANNTNDDTAASAFVEIRLFGWAPGTTPVLVGSASTGSGTDRNLVGFDVVSTPTNCNLNNNPDWVGERYQLLIEEERDADGSTTAIRTRTFDKKPPSSPSPDFDNQHGPDLTAGDPLGIDHQVPASSIDPGGVSLTGRSGLQRNGQTVGLYFQQGDHLWYQEFNGSSWFFSSGLPDPQLVDNSTIEDFDDAEVFGRLRHDSCDELSGGIVVIEKQISDNNVQRILLRVHN